MSAVDIIVLAGLAVWLIIAVRHIVKRKGSCSGDCANCPYKCKKR